MLMRLMTLTRIVTLASVAALAVTVTPATALAQSAPVVTFTPATTSTPALSGLQPASEGSYWEIIGGLEFDTDGMMFGFVGPQWNRPLNDNMRLTARA